MSFVEKSKGEQAQKLKAVVSLLDEEHTRRVQYLWDEMEARFGVEATFRTPVPHFSYQVAEDYEMDHLKRVLSDAAQDQPPFSVTTSGLGVFTGPHPTLYVPVIRTAALSAFHERLYPRLAEIATEIRPYFTSRYWAPHITLALAEISPQTIAEILQHFSRRDFTWEITVDNVAVICDMCGEEGVQLRFDFGGAIHTNPSK